MRFQIVAVSLVAAASLAACSSSSGGKGSTVSAPKAPASGGTTSSSAPVSTPASAAGSGSGGGSVSDAAFCANLAKVGEQVGSLTADASDPTKLKTLLGAEATFLASLKAGAPAELVPTLDDLSTLLKEAESAFANPNSPDLAKLQALATKLPADTQKLEAYLTSKCAPGS
jgi:hypothetical protein